MFTVMMKGLLLFKSGVIISCLFLGIAVLAEDKDMLGKTDSTRVIFNFADSSETDKWIAINDNVMGGLSKGGFSRYKDGALLFSGTISLENNGGFASIRAMPEGLDLSGYTGVRIRIKGDGRTYQFRIRTNRNSGEIAYKHDFTTITDTWTEIDFPFVSFVPTYRGRILRNVPELVASDIKQLGFLIADKKAGSFKLIVDEIKAYK
jgi:monofunctional biosynthetic peptidoglycan transglycosylase